MSTRHRWLIASIPFAACLYLSTPFLYAGSTDPDSGSGPVGLRELIALALQNDPELVRLRSRIPIKEAQKIAAKEWRDPEIRVGLSKDDNLQLDQPYFRTIEGSNTTSGASETTELRGDSTGTSTERNNFRIRELVTPTENGERIERRESETRRTTSIGPDGEKIETERNTSTSNQTRYDSRDPFARDHSASIKARFYIPKPWEMRRKVNQAAMEIDLAKYEIVAAERRVKLRVREEYEKLQFLNRKLKAGMGAKNVIEEHQKKQEELYDLNSDLFRLDDMDLDVGMSLILAETEIDLARGLLDAAKGELARMVGLSNGSRIRVTDNLIRTNINLTSTDLEYLIRMAHVFRGEIGVLKHEKRIAEGELQVVKSKRIPWFSFLEASYARDKTGGYHTNDNYGVQFGVVLPLFSWLKRDERVVEAQIESYYTTLKASQNSIATEVAESYRNVKSAAALRSKIAARQSQFEAQAKKSQERMEATPKLGVKEDLRYKTARLRDDFRKKMIEADRMYNQAIIRLEQSLGADLNDVFNVEIELLEGALPGDEVQASAAPSQATPSTPQPDLKQPNSLEESSESTETAPEKRHRTGFLGRLRNKNQRTSGKYPPLRRALPNRR